MKKLMSLILVTSMVLVTMNVAFALEPGVVGAENTAVDINEECDEKGITIEGAVGESADRFFFGKPFVTAEAPVVITADEGFNNFGVSTLVKMGEQYIEGTYLSPDGYESYDVFQSSGVVPAGTTFTIKDPGLYYVWATDNDSQEPFEIPLEVLNVPAAYTASTVLVDGKMVDFEAYNINDNNYFKLRDIAKVLNGTAKQFDVVWNADTSSIDLLSGKAYSEVGGELIVGDGTAKKAITGTGDIAKDGEYVYLKAYMINNNNFFKLRDLGEVFDFDVSWDANNNCIIIDTNSSYTAD